MGRSPNKNKNQKKRKEEKMNNADTETETRRVPLVVTTEHRGVFFGYGTPNRGNVIRLEEARMCVYWSADCKGVLGLAAHGPTKGCRIGPAAPAITLQKVTSVMEVSPEAEAKWKKEPWNSCYCS
jgi:hypothetical protein